MKAQLLRAAYWLLEEIGNALGWIGVGGTTLHAWAKRNREALLGPDDSDTAGC